VSSATGKKDKGKPERESKFNVKGVIAAKSGSTITVDGQVIEVPASAVIHHRKRRLTFGDLSVGDRVRVKGVRTTRNEARDVKLKRPGDPDDDDEDDGDDDDDNGGAPPPPPPAQVPVVSVEVTDGSASEASLDPAEFRFTRTGDVTRSLTVTVSVSGSATNGSDYQSVGMSVTFAAGSDTAVVVINPLADTDATEGAETVTLTITDGQAYDVGASSSATVTIVPFVNS
jgi:hypothetical protein